MIFKTIKITVLALLALIGTHAAAQDLLARQAPIDRKLKSIDSLALIKQIKSEQAAFPAYALYPNWSNTSVHAYGKVALPDSFKIDLRGFTMPTSHTTITSKFGPRWRRMHNGLDIKVYIGDTIRSAFDGKVRIVQYERRGYGNYVVIRHDNGLETIYGHLSKQLVKENQVIKSGEPIGLGGNTGRSTGSHLHFETRVLGKAINPEFLFDFPHQDIVKDFYVFRSNGSSKSEGSTLMASSSSSDEGIRYHKVRKGDTLSIIAKSSKTTITALCKLNRITTKTKLRPGQVLRCS